MHYGYSGITQYFCEVLFIKRLSRLSKILSTLSVNTKTILTVEEDKDIEQAKSQFT